jgi:sugar phosphate isomerase/epimerase
MEIRRAVLKRKEAAAMKLSVFTAMMVEGRVFDRTGRRLPPDEYIERIAQAGYRGLEWGIDDSYALVPAVAEREAERLVERSRGLGLETVSIASGASVDDPEAVRRMLEIAARLEAPALRVSLREYEPRRSYAEQVDRGTQDFARALEAARPYGIRLLIEIHFGFLCPSASLAHRFLSAFDVSAAGAILDPGNMIVEGRENWGIGAELLGGYLAHVHVKNISWAWTTLDWLEHPTDRAHWQWQMVGLEEGIVDWQEVIAALKTAGYRGWYSLEDFSTRPLAQKLQEGTATLGRLLK